MAESENGAPSTSNAKEKKSLLDEDISKEFLSSWKSMSVTDTDTMDFTFEPVSKSNKNAFNFDKLDMDFSLDGDFKKLPSFQLDMCDLDFSSSPKKSPNAKEKSEGGSSKGSHQGKKDRFSFSFDFNELDDFSLDAPLMKEGKKSCKNDSGKEAGLSNKTDDHELSNQLLIDNSADEDATTRKAPALKGGTSSKSENLAVSEVDLKAPTDNYPSKLSTLPDPIQSKGSQISHEKMVTVKASETDQQTDLANETSLKESYAQPTTLDHDKASDSHSSESIISPQTIQSEATQMSPEKKVTFSAQEKNTKPCAQSTASDASSLALLDKDSTQGVVPVQIQILQDEKMGIQILQDEKMGNGNSERSICNGEMAVDNDSQSEVISPRSLTEKENGDSEKTELADVENSLIVLPSSDAEKTSASGASRIISHVARSNYETERASAKSNSASGNSQSTADRAQPIRNKPPGVNPTTFSLVQGTNNCSLPKALAMRRKLALLTRNNTTSTHFGPADKREGNDADSAQTVTKLSEDPSSLAKEAREVKFKTYNSERNANDRSVSRVSSNAMDAKIRNEAGVNFGPPKGEVLKGAVRFIGREKSIKDVKPSSLIVQHSIIAEEAKITSNQDPGKHELKISSMGSIQKSLCTEGSKLFTLKFGKTTPDSSSLKISRNTTTDNHSRFNAQENTKCPVNSTGNSSSQLTTKIGDSKVTEQHTPLTPSLKRKSPKVSDATLAALHPPKRFSPGEKRAVRVPIERVTEEEVHISGSPSGKNDSDEYMTPTLGFKEPTMGDLEIALMMENDGNVEKAEAYAKELEDICNMLRKRHEEAKELLVRAVVNNNNLLMLNHPIYDEKIRSLEKFFARLMSRQVYEL